MREIYLLFVKTSKSPTRSSTWGSANRRSLCYEIFLVFAPIPSDTSGTRWFALRNKATKVTLRYAGASSCLAKDTSISFSAQLSFTFPITRATNRGADGRHAPRPVVRDGAGAGLARVAAAAAAPGQRARVARHLRLFAGIAGVARVPGEVHLAPLLFRLLCQHFLLQVLLTPALCGGNVARQETVEAGTTVFGVRVIS